MTGLRAALATEWLKARRSRVPWLVGAGTSTEHCATEAADQFRHRDREQHGSARRYADKATDLDAVIRIIKAIAALGALAALAALAGVLYVVIAVLPPVLVDETKLRADESVVEAEPKHAPS